MAAIHNLIEQIADVKLRERIRSEWTDALKEKKFGLVFEEHKPELLPMYNSTPQIGDLVCRSGSYLKETLRVVSTTGNTATCQKRESDGDLASLPAQDSIEEIPISELVVVKEFGDPIFPALIKLDEAQNAELGRASHSLIQADNYHALQLLNYVVPRKVDCIYIDPPYNTGAKDWKYNNDYVDDNDSWRHSKWLAFMERRLKLAKSLLNPDNGVLIVTIDEHEVHHLGMLIKELYPEARTQMVTIVNNAAGVSQGGFYRVEEYAFFCFLGDAKPIPQDDDFLSEDLSIQTPPYWFSLIRYGGINALPAKRPNLVYPIYIDNSTGEIKRLGSSLKELIDAGQVPFASNDWLPEKESSSEYSVIWPFRGNGSMATWQLNQETLMQLYEDGFVRIRRQKNGPGGNKFSISYVKSGNRQKVKDGIIPKLGYEDDGHALKLGPIDRKVIPKTVWKRSYHDAGKWGSRVLRETLGDVSFDYAKSPYSVRDCLSAAVGDKKDALILDFFSGSGTTLLATELLNLSDNGRRHCILVTNNELQSEVAKRLKNNGVTQNSEEWEQHGICQSVTWPRIKYSVLGKRDDGKLLEGSYLTGKKEYVEQKPKCTHIGFVPSDSLKSVQAKKQLVSLIDGISQSNVSSESDFLISDSKGTSILFDFAAKDEFIEKLKETAVVREIFLVTEDTREFKAVKQELNDALGGVKIPKQLKRNMSEGLNANVSYFKLDFLDKDRVALGLSLKEILPLLWMIAGSVGPCHTDEELLNSPIIHPEGSNFVVLTDEVFIQKLHSKLSKEKQEISYIFIVTDSDESFKSISLDIQSNYKQNQPNIKTVQLYRDYLQNFMINKHQNYASGRFVVGIENS
ncbi:MAG: site-specific DNA-methyltransferase (adenine-specific) [Idiomarina sp. T82-3]|uniref:site-specific DNA-methyltransferase n=1 Tax=Idiomarina TaxID=135575 RepID=UPI00079399DD|nr:DNA methyltransferase [Idiomarina sp. T82-3]KXS33882.1 MAG: site-specific DNA-methyltransferase (adenine-specific) [Idiomarina sp. T82-3]